MALEVLDGGMLTTVQDLGRYGYERFGIPVAGAMDPFALRAANTLVGNSWDKAGLEITLTGPTCGRLVLPHHPTEVYMPCPRSLSPSRRLQLFLVVLATKEENTGCARKLLHSGHRTFFVSRSFTVIAREKSFPHFLHWNS